MVDAKELKLVSGAFKVNMAPVHNQPHLPELELKMVVPSVVVMMA